MFFWNRRLVSQPSFAELGAVRFFRIHMAVSFQRYWRTVSLAAATLWASLIVLYAFYVFVYPTIPNYGPEIGPAASFVSACILFSVYYLGFFLFAVIPIACIIRFFLPKDRTHPPEA